MFFRVVLPLIKPGLAAAAIFTFRIAWNEFILALVLTDRSTRTLPVAASLYITDIGVDWGKIMALGSLIAIPPLIFTFVAAQADHHRADRGRREGLMGGGRRRALPADRHTRGCA